MVFGVDAGVDAMYHGFPRVVILGDRRGHPFPSYAVLPDVPILRLDIDGGAGWWKRDQAPLSGRLDVLLSEVASAPSWVDSAFRSMTELSGAALAPAFRGFCRRVLEYPGLYSDMHALARLTGLSRGAIKARFRRRGLRSPSEHLRWLRILAAGHVQGTSATTTAGAAYRLGYTLRRQPGAGDPGGPGRQSGGSQGTLGPDPIAGRVRRAVHHRGSSDAAMGSVRGGVPENRGRLRVVSGPGDARPAGTAWDSAGAAPAKSERLPPLFGWEPLLDLGALGTRKARPVPSGAVSTLPPPFPTDGGFALALPLGARLLVEPPLAQLGVEA